jgi:RecJ-like exonuclease
LDKYEQFKKSAAEAAEEFKKLDKKQKIRIISHLDADGISACAIVMKALDRENVKYFISIVHQIDDLLLKRLASESSKTVIFCDIGSGQLSAIKDFLHEKRVFVFDHHYPERVESANVTNVNPHLFGIDGSREISGAGVVYFFAKALNQRNEDLAHIAVIGAIGDVQENMGFLRLNNEVLETAKKTEKIKVIKGLRVFGAQTKPLHKVLEQSTEYVIPGVTGSESQAVQFLHQIGINPKNGNNWKKLVDLDEEEMRKLATGIVIKRLGEEKPEGFIGPVYLLTEEKNESPLKDAKEFSTLLNACGRLGKASLGIGVCLNDKKIKEKAVQHMANYKKELIKALDWYNTNSDSEFVIRGKNYLIINAKNSILPTMIGTLASMISKSKELKPGTFVLSMAQQQNSTTKVSLRVAGQAKADLISVITQAANGVGGQAGGHVNAAGAIISTDKETEFIESAKKIFENFTP